MSAAAPGIAPAAKPHRPDLNCSTATWASRAAILMVLRALIFPSSAEMPSCKFCSVCKMSRRYSPQSPSLSGAISDSTNDGKSEDPLSGNERPEDDLNMDCSTRTVLTGQSLRQVHRPDCWVREVARDVLRVTLPHGLGEEHVNRL